MGFNSVTGRNRGVVLEGQKKKADTRVSTLMPAVAGSRRGGFFTFPDRRPQFGNGRFPAQKTPGNVK